MEIYNRQTADKVIGCVLQKPELLLDTKYKIDVHDFKNAFQRVMFGTIYNLAIRGYKSVSIMDIDTFVSPYKAEYDCIKTNNFEGYVSTLMKIVDPNNFDGYYNHFKKYSCLNTCHENGIDVSKYYNFDASDEENDGRIASVTVDEITKFYSGMVEEIKSKFASTTREEAKVGDNFISTLEEFEETPYYGAVMTSPYQTALYRGWCKGQVILSSGASGTGKTIRAVGELCNVCATELFNIEENRWEENLNCQNEGGLFINTEMDLKKELEPMFAAYIAGVERSKIMDGKITKEERERLVYATEVMKESNLYMIDSPKFTLETLESDIKRYVYNHNIGYVVFDYCQDNGVISKEMRKTHEVVARDTIILNLVDALKNWSRDYDIAIMSGTQLNGNEKINDVIDEACLSGGRACKFKVDNGTIFMYPRKKELAAYDLIKEKRGFDHIMPNVVCHNYKTRFGKYGQNTKTLQYVDLGTGRVTDLCVLNQFNEPIKVEGVKYGS